MQTALKLTAPILPGRRIEISSPELPEYGTVELIIVLPEQSQPQEDAAASQESIVDFITSLPKRSYTPEEWEEMERELQESRNSWDR